MLSKTITTQYGPGSNSDSQLTRTARLQQAWYRQHKLEIHECGVSPNTKLPLQSYLPGGKERQNFLSNAAFDYAQQRLKDKGIEPLLTINANRLMFNMLSSMPMCFNLFADLRAAVLAGSDISATVGAMFPAVSVDSVQDITVEEVPPSAKSRRRNLIGDKTGWDASIRYNNGTGLITIETKYTDRLDTAAPASENPTAFQVADELNLFTNAGLAYYQHLPRKAKKSQHGQPKPSARHGGFDQLARNLLLTMKYAHDHDITDMHNYVLAPAFDTQAPDAINQMQLRLQPHARDLLQWRTLDDVVLAAQQVATPDVAKVYKHFTTRYLDLDPARNLLAISGEAKPGKESAREGKA